VAEKKLQHYVPQFHLKLFSTSVSDRQICICNIDHSRFIPSAAIRDQAAENYFYKSREIEDALADFEGRVATIIKDILNNSRLPKHGSDTFDDLVFPLAIPAMNSAYVWRTTDASFTWSRSTPKGEHGDGCLRARKPTHGS
jgi:hypothetical protein